MVSMIVVYCSSHLVRVLLSIQTPYVAESMQELSEAFADLSKQFMQRAAEIDHVWGANCYML